MIDLLLSLLPWRLMLVAGFCLVLAEVVTLLAFRALGSSNLRRR